MNKRAFFTYYLLITGVIANVAFVGFAIFLIVVVLGSGYSYGLFSKKLANYIDSNYPKLSGVSKALLPSGSSAMNLTPFTTKTRRDYFSSEWAHKGARPELFDVHVAFGANGKPVFSAVPDSVRKTTFSVHNVDELQNALNKVAAGEVIEIHPGTYRIKRKYIKIGHGGTALAPIVVRAAQVDTVVIEFDAMEGFYIDKPYIIFRDLYIKGVCETDSSCEHAFHVFGDAQHTIIFNNTIQNFNAMIKVNGSNQQGSQSFPDFGVITNNTLFNDSGRKTSNPVTPIDIVGASDWQISDNVIYDFKKDKGDKVSYAAFAKGNAVNSVFERNLVLCALFLPSENDVRVGLSFGGGGTAQGSCRGQVCVTEHTHGIIRNNIIMNCENDVGIYLNKASDTQIYNNTLYRTLGIDVRFPTSAATISDNILSGRIKARDGGIVHANNNVFGDESGFFSSSGFDDWFVNIGALDFSLKQGKEIIKKARGGGDVQDDYCGNKRRQANSDLGAIEFGQKRCGEVLGY